MNELLNQLKQLWGNVQSWFQSLSTRERRLVVLAGSGVAVFALLMTLFSLSSSASLIQRRTNDKLAKLQVAQELAATYKAQEVERTNIMRQLSNNGIRLITYVTEKGTAAGLEIPSISPKSDLPIGDGNILESGVDLTLTDINIRRLVDFLTNVEAGGMVKVKSLRIEPRVANETLTAWITLATYRLKQ